MNATICSAGGYCPPDSPSPVPCPASYYCPVGVDKPLPCRKGKQRKEILLCHYLYVFFYLFWQILFSYHFFDNLFSLFVLISHVSSLFSSLHADSSLFKIYHWPTLSLISSPTSPSVYLHPHAHIHHRRTHPLTTTLSVAFHTYCHTQTHNYYLIHTYIMYTYTGTYCPPSTTFPLACPLGYIGFSTANGTLSSLGSFATGL